MHRLGVKEIIFQLQACRKNGLGQCGSIVTGIQDKITFCICTCHSYICVLGKHLLRLNVIIVTSGGVEYTLLFLVYTLTYLNVTLVLFVSEKKLI